MLDRRMISANGVRLGYQAHGPETAPPVVLLHALMSSSHTWRRLARSMAASYRLLALDLRGHGESEWPGQYSLELMRDDVLAFMDALDLIDVCLLGHSLGAAVASRVAQHGSSRLTALVLEELPVPPETGEEFDLADRPSDDLPYDWEAVRAILKQVSNPDPAWWEGLGSIGVPTLVVAGGPDSVVDQDRMADAAARIPVCSLVSIPSGHRVHGERPEEFARAVMDFLQDAGS